MNGNNIGAEIRQKGMEALLKEPADVDADIFIKNGIRA